MASWPQAACSCNDLQNVWDQEGHTGNDAAVSATHAPIRSAGLARPANRIGIGVGRASDVLLKRIPPRTGFCGDPKHLFYFPSWILSILFIYLHLRILIHRRDMTLKGGVINFDAALYGPCVDTTCIKSVC